MRFQLFPPKRTKSKVIGLVLSTIFLSSIAFSSTNAQLWGIKKINGEEFKEIISKLLIYDDPNFPSYNKIFRLHYTDPKKLLDALNAKIKITPEIKKIVGTEEDLDDLTYGRYILNAIYEEELIERGARVAFAPDQANGKFFANLADNLADWKSQLGKILLEKILEGTFLVIGSPSLITIGVSTLGLATDLFIIGSGIKKINERLYERGLWHYLQCRKQLGYDHISAWNIAKLTGAGAITNKNEMQTQNYFESLWDRYEEYITGYRSEEDFKAKQRKKLKTLLLYALGAEPHVVVTSPLEIISPPYQEGDKIEAAFSVANYGDLPIFLESITVGGRYEEKEIVDFPKKCDIRLDINGSYLYHGTLALTKAGNYHFFCAYQTPDGKWNPSIDLGPGLADEDRVEDIIVSIRRESADEKANRLYVEARQLFESALEVEETSYPDALPLYRDIVRKLETIISRYPSSNIAVELIKENTLEEFKEALRWAILRADAEKSPFACTLYLVKKWYTGGGDPRHEFDEVSSVATEYAEIGQKDKALKVLDELLSKAEEVRHFDYRGGALIMVATKYAEIGQFEQALGILDRNGIPLGVLALPTKHADLDQLDKVLDAVRATDWPYSQEGGLAEMAVEVLIKIAGRYAELGEEKKAEETLAEALVGAQRSPELLIEIASKYAELGQKNKALEVLEEAFEVIRVIGPSDHRNWLSGEVATIYAELGQKGKAAEVLAEAVESVESSKLYPLTEIAKSKSIDLGLAEEALIDKLEKLIKAPQAASGSTKVVVLINIASKFIKLGQEEKAKEALSEAFFVSLKNSLHLAPSIVAKWIELGEEKKARELLSIALKREKEKAEGTVISWSGRNPFLVDVALQFVSLGQPERAFEIVKEIGRGYYNKGTAYIKEWEAQKTIYLSIANKYIELGQLEEALEVERRWGDSKTLAKIANKYIELGQLEEALEVAEEIEENTYRNQTLAKIANKYIELGQLEEALEIERRWADSKTLAKIASKYLELGQPDKAFEVAKKMPIKDPKLLGDIAVKYAQLGQPEQTYDIIKRIWDRKRRGSRVDDTLDKLATTWAELGKFEEALQMVEKISSEIRQAKTLMEIDLRYAELAQEVEEGERKILHGIVKHTHRK